jgi:AsmA protein
MKTKPSKQSPEQTRSSGALASTVLGVYGVTGMVLSSVSPVKLPFAESYAKEHWRHALGGFVLVLLLLAGAIGFALHLLDPNDFKSQIVSYVKTKKQRDLVLDGDIQVTLFPRLGLDTGKLTLSQRNSSQKFVSVDNARLYVAWWPLFRKQIQVESIVLDGVHANVIRDKDGSTNFDDLLVGADQLGDVKFEVERIRVLGSSVNIRDEASNTALSLHDLEVDTGHLADATSGRVNTSFRLESKQPRIDARIKMHGHVLYDRAGNRFEVANVEGEAHGEAVGIADLVADFRGSLIARPASQQLQLNKLSGSAKGKVDQQVLEARLAADVLTLENMQWRGSALTAGGMLSRNEEKLTASFEVPLFETDKTAFRSENVRASFELLDSGASVQGKFTSPASFDSETRQLQFDAIAGQWSGSHPLLASKLNANGSGKLRVAWPAQEIRLDFKTKIDDSEFIGYAQLNDFKAPAYAFDVAVDKLDVDRYLAGDWAKRYQDEAKPFDLSSLKTLDLRGKLRSNEFKWGKLKAQQLSADIRVASSALSIEPIEARLYGGSVQGGLTIAAADVPHVESRQRLTGVLLDALLADVLPGEALLTGKGNLAWDLSAEGQNITGLRQTLKGSANVALAGGKLAGINLADALAAGKDQVGIQGAERSDAIRLTESTAFTELKASLDIAQGKVRSSDLLMKTPLLVCKGEGDFALDSGQLGGQISTAVAPGLRRANAGTLAELSGTSIPLRINGPWATAAVTYALGEASGGNAPRLAKANLARVAAASPVEVGRPTGK